MHPEKNQCVVPIIHLKTLSCKVKKKEAEICFPLLPLWRTIIDVIILPDRCCLYWVDHLQSIARWEKKSKKVRSEKNADRHTDCNASHRRTVHEPPFNLMSIRDRQKPRPLPVLQGNCWGKEIAKSYVNTQRAQQLFITQLSQTVLEKVH